MLRKMVAGSVSQAVPVFVQSASSAANGGLGGLVFNTAGLICRYRRQGQSSWTAVSLVSGTLGTWAAGAFTADASTGWYELGIPDAALVAGAEWVQIELSGAPDMTPSRVFIELDTINYQVPSGYLPTNTVQLAGVAAEPSNVAEDVWSYADRTLTSMADNTADITSAVTAALPSVADVVPQVLGTTMLTVTPSGRYVDENGNTISTMTVHQLLIALFVTMCGDRTGVGTSAITTHMPGYGDCTLTAQRVSASIIEATIRFPTDYSH